ncbi:MAG: NUDIX hydrolase [Candidatus Saccharibacteria bacterium]|nr:NUDIX hydrolase [Candidatus Saccharibacteria bacterium]
MKQFRKTGEDRQPVGGKFPNEVIIKYYQTDDGLNHEFTTFGNETVMGPSVVALTDDNKVLLTRQFRAGPEKWLYDFPSGRLEDGESAEECARRELQEETGYVPQDLEYAGEYYIDPYVNGVCPVFLATGCRRGVEDIGLDQQEHQQGAELHLVTIEELFAIIKRGEFCSVAPVALLCDRLLALCADSVKLIREK